jgi:hypothetical protein
VSTCEGQPAPAPTIARFVYCYHVAEKLDLFSWYVMRIAGRQLGQVITFADAFGAVQRSAAAAAATVVKRVLTLPGGFLREPAGPIAHQFLFSWKGLKGASSGACFTVGGASVLMFRLTPKSCITL